MFSNPTHTHHPEQHQPPIEPKPTTICLIMYKHYTHTHTHTHSLSHTHTHTHTHTLSYATSLMVGLSEAVYPWRSKRKPWTHLPSSFHMIKTRKIKLQIHPACSFCSATPGKKKKKLISQVDKVNTCVSDSYPYNLHGEMFPSRCGILAQAISITFTSLQERQSIFLAWFLKYPHLHQLKFHYTTM